MSQSAQVWKSFDSTHFLISHCSQCPILTPASLHPVQLIISGVMPCALYWTIHFSAVLVRNSLSFAIVAILASQAAQFKPQHAIIFPIFISFKGLIASFLFGFSFTLCRIFSELWLKYISSKWQPYVSSFVVSWSTRIYFAAGCLFLGHNFLFRTFFRDSLWYLFFCIQNMC